MIVINELSDIKEKMLIDEISLNLNPRFINVYLSGRIKKMGTNKISRASSINDAINVPVNFKSLREKISFIRVDMNEEIKKSKITYSSEAKSGSFNIPNLNDGDNIFFKSREVITEVTTPFSDLFFAYCLLKVISG